MRFSILLPTRNRQQMLDAAIASVLAQTHPDWELIVLDNSDSPQQVAKDKRVRHFHVPPAPVASLFNQALDLAEGEIVCHFADDDLLPPDALAIVASKIGDADWLVAGTEIRDESGNVLTTRGGTRDFVERTRGGVYMLGGAVYWRKALSDLVGGYDVEYDGAADFDLFLRFLRHSEPVVIPNTLYLYTDWPGTDSNLRAERQRQQTARIARGA